MSIGELKTKLSESKKHIEDLKEKQTEVALKLVDVRESLPVLKIAVTNARLDRQRAADRVVLNEATTDDLQKYDEALMECEKKYVDGQALFDVLTREVKILTDGIPKGITESELLKRQAWESIADEIKSEIPSKVFGLVEKWLSVTTQLGQPYEFSLQRLFTRPSTSRIQEIQKDLSKKYELD